MENKLEQSRIITYSIPRIEVPNSMIHHFSEGVWIHSTLTTHSLTYPTLSRTALKTRKNMISPRLVIENDSQSLKVKFSIFRGRLQTMTENQS